MAHLIMQQQTVFSSSFIALSVANLLMFTAFYFIMPILPLYLTQELQASKTITGIILAAYTIAALVTRPLAGFLADRYTGKRLFIITYIAFGLCFVGYLAPVSLGFLFFLRILHGIAFSIVTTAATTYVIAIIPPQKMGTGIGIFGTTAALAMALGPMCGMFLLENHSYYMVFLASVAVFFTGLLAASVIRPLEDKKPCAKEKFSLRSLFVPSVKHAFWGVVSATFIYGLLLHYLSLYVLEKNIDFNAGHVFAFLATGLICSRFFAGRLIDSGKLTTVITTGLLIIIGAFTLFIATESSVLFILATLGIGIGYGLLTPAYQTLFTLLAAPEQRGRANSLFFTAFDLGIGASVFIGGAIADYSNLSASFILGVGFLVFSLFYFFYVVAPHYLHIARHGK